MNTNLTLDKLKLNRSLFDVLSNHVHSEDTKPNERNYLETYRYHFVGDDYYGHYEKNEAIENYVNNINPNIICCAFTYKKNENEIFNLVYIQDKETCIWTLEVLVNKFDINLPTNAHARTI